MDEKKTNEGPLDEAEPGQEGVRARIERTVLETLGGSPEPKPRAGSLQTVLFRGLAVVLPPLLTLVILLWVGGTVNTYVIQPIFTGSRYLLLLTQADIISAKEARILRGKQQKRKTEPVSPQAETDPSRQSGGAVFPETLRHRNKDYTRCADGTYVPSTIYGYVEQAATDGITPMPQTGIGIYEQYIELIFLRPYLFIPVLFLLFFLLIYLIGKLIAARAGRFVFNLVERLVTAVPLVRDVYGAVKKVINLAFGEQEVRVSRVVAVQWPREGIWALALVTSEGMPAVEKHVGEPMFAVLIPTSPMPATGFTLHVKRSETVDLGITIDQAIQFVVSCGVVTLADPQVKRI